MTLSISEINIIPVKPQHGLVAFASCAIDNAFRVDSIAVYTAPNHPLGFRLVFPTKKISSGRQFPIFYPFRKEAEEIITKAIVTEYCELMGKFCCAE